MKMLKINHWTCWIKKRDFKVFRIVNIAFIANSDTWRVELELMGFGFWVAHRKQKDRMHST